MIIHVGEMKHTGTELRASVFLGELGKCRNQSQQVGVVLFSSRKTCELEDDLICSLYRSLHFPLAALHRELLGVQGCPVKIPKMTWGPELHINS